MSQTDTTTLRFLSGTVLVVLAAGLIIRLVLAPTLTYPFDIEHWAVISQNMDSGNGLYGLSGYFYTPVWGYILGFETLLMNSIGGLDLMGERFTNILGIECLEFRFYTATVTTPVYNIVMKIPLILVDVVTGYLLWGLVAEKTSSKKKADLAFCLWFLCPVVVYMSGIQAQFDCMSAMFTLLTVLLLRKDHCLLAGAMFVVAILIKFFPVFLIAVLILYLWKKHRADGKTLRCIGSSVLGAMVAVAVIYAPQIMDGTFVDSLSFVIGRASESDVAQTFYTCLMVLITVLIMYHTARHVLRSDMDADDELMLMTVLVLSAATMISTGPQYCIVYLPFLAYFAAVSDSKLYTRCMVAIGVLSMLVAFLNNNFSILTPVAEYWGWLSPESIVDVMDSLQYDWVALRWSVQAVQMVALFLTFAFLFTDTVKGEHRAIRLINVIKSRVGGEANEAE